MKNPVQVSGVQVLSGERLGKRLGSIKIMQLPNEQQNNTEFTRRI